MQLAVIRPRRRAQTRTSMRLSETVTGMNRPCLMLEAIGPSWRLATESIASQCGASFNALDKYYY